MKKIKLKEGGTRSELFYDWPAVVSDNRLNHETEIEAFLENELKEDKELLGYYTNMLLNMPEHKDLFDYELRSRHLDLYIAPQSEELEYYSKPQKITQELVIEIVRAKDFSTLLRSLRSFYGPVLNARLCASLLVAICLDRRDLVTAIKGHINKIGTFQVQAKDFIEKNATEAMVNHILDLYQVYLDKYLKRRQRKQLGEESSSKVKVLRLQEASSLSAYDKMDLFNRGQRRENLRACSTLKLVTYYKICLNNKFKRAERMIAIELLLRRGGVYVKPDPVAIDESQFTPYEAKFILQNKDSVDNIIESSAQHPFTGLSCSDTLTIYLVFAIALGETEVVKAIKRQMRLYNTYYDVMPEILDELLNRPGIADKITDIINNL